MARGGGMQEVELLDGNEPVAEPRADQPQGPARTRRGLRWAVAGAVVVALSLVGTQWVVDRREDAAIARLAAVPGVLPPIGDELTVARTLTRNEIMRIWAGIANADGAAVSLQVAVDGSQAIVAVDPDSGDTIWSTPLLGPNAERAASGDAAYGGGCFSDVGPREVATAVVCLVTDGFTRITSGDEPDRVPATTTRAMVFDPADGHVVAERAVDADARLAALPGIWLVGTQDADSTDVVAYDLRTGEERWRYDEPRDARTGDDEGSSLYWSFFRAGDMVAYSVGLGGLGMLSSTGESVRDDLRDSAGGRGWSADPETGEFAVFDYNSGGGSQSTTLVAADGDPADDVVLDGSLMQLGVDDGSLPGLVLTSDQKLRAWDRSTGGPRWEATVQDASSALVVRGRVYTTTGTGLVALDGRTGTVVWETTVPSSAIGTLATDGRDLLLSTAIYRVDGELAPGGRVGATGYDLATGEETRYVPYPEGVVDIQMLRGLLIGWSDDRDEVRLLE